jgi:hypothetical protein
MTNVKEGVKEVLPVLIYYSGMLVEDMRTVIKNVRTNSSQLNFEN